MCGGGDKKTVSVWEEAGLKSGVKLGEVGHLQLLGSTKLVPTKYQRCLRLGPDGDGMFRAGVTLASISQGFEEIAR